MNHTSHRRKPTKERQPKESDYTVKDYGPIEDGHLAGTIEAILQRSDENFTCPSCSSRQHGYLDLPDDGSAFVCHQCGKQVPVMIPVYLGKSHDLVMGYQIIEYGKEHEGLRVHMIGHFPGPPPPTIN